jgi:glutamate synthase (NADPH/NADH)
MVSFVYPFNHPGAKEIVNFEILPPPTGTRAADNPWPQFPRVMRVDYGHEEVRRIYGKDPREYSILSKEFIGNSEGHVTGIKTVKVEWKKDDAGQWKMNEVPGSEQIFEADLVLLSMGFLGPEKKLIEKLEVKQDGRSNVSTPKGSYATNVPGVFAAGDCRRGQSLIVWGIQEGRQAAREIDVFLMGSSILHAHGGMYARPVIPDPSR